MNKLNNLKYNTYNILQIIFPKIILIYLGQLTFLKPFRDILFGRNDKSYFEDYIQWNKIKFHFFASPQVLYKAKNRGIENSLTRAILKIIDTNSNIIDIGANYGFMTIVFAKYIFKKKVKSFHLNVKKIFLTASRNLSRKTT